MTTTLLMAAALPVLLVLSGFFSGSETALFSLTRHQRAALARSPHLTAQTITSLLAHTRQLLITLLLGNMTINVLYFVISSVLLIRLGKQGTLSGPAVAVLSLAPLVAIILLGEVLPKLVAARATLAWSRFIAVPMMIVHRTMAPVRIFCSVAVVGPLARLIAPTAAPPALSHDELDSLLEQSQRKGVLDPSEQQVLEQVLELGRLKVRDLMTPRVDMLGFDLADDPAALIELIRESRVRHIPAYEGGPDHVAGILYARQVLLHRPANEQELRKLVRSVKFIPEQQRADRLLIHFRKTGQTFAIVVNEYGGTAGIITLEDVVEHLVGDIPGAADDAEPEVEKLAPGRFRVTADLAIHDWSDLFGRNAAVDAVRTTSAISTLGGLVMSRLGRVPDVGDEVTIGSNLKLRVDAMDGSRIDRIVVELSGGGGSVTPTSIGGKEADRG